MEIKDILERCDHTLLRVDCTGEEIRKLCDQAMKYHCASVCIPPCHVAGARRYAGDRLKICTVIGFPNGYATSAVKAFEAGEVYKASERLYRDPEGAFTVYALTEPSYLYEHLKEVTNQALNQALNQASPD